MKSLKILGSFILLLTLSAFAFNASMLKEGYKIGDPAADFELRNVDGKTVSLSDFPEAKGFMVIFTCNTCPYAVAYEDRIIALDKKYRPQGIPVIAINPNNPEVQPADSFEHMKKRAKEKGFTFPYLLDEGQTVYPKYGATRTPHVFLLERTAEANLVRYIGTIDDNYSKPEAVETRYVENAVEALLKGENIEIEETRAIGCSIKV